MVSMSPVAIYDKIGTNYNQTRTVDPRILRNLLDSLNLPPQALIADIGAEGAGWCCGICCSTHAGIHAGLQELRKVFAWLGALLHISTAHFVVTTILKGPRCLVGSCTLYCELFVAYVAATLQEKVATFYTGSGAERTDQGAKVSEHSTNDKYNTPNVVPSSPTTPIEDESAALIPY